MCEKNSLQLSDITNLENIILLGVESVQNVRINHQNAGKMRMTDYQTVVERKV